MTGNRSVLAAVTDLVAGRVLTACGAGPEHFGAATPAGERRASLGFSDVRVCFRDVTSEPLVLKVGQRSGRFDQECVESGTNTSTGTLVRPVGTFVMKIGFVNKIGSPRVFVHQCDRCEPAEDKFLVVEEEFTFQPPSGSGPQAEVRRLPDGGTKNSEVDVRDREVLRSGPGRGVPGGVRLIAPSIRCRTESIRHRTGL